MVKDSLPHGGGHGELPIRGIGLAGLQVGDAEQVKDEIQRYAEIAGSDQFLLRVQWPGLEHEEALGNIERIGRIIADLG